MSDQHFHLFHFQLCALTLTLFEFFELESQFYTELRSNGDRRTKILYLWWRVVGYDGMGGMTEPRQHARSDCFPLWCRLVVQWRGDGRRCHVMDNRKVSERFRGVRPCQANNWSKVATQWHGRELNPEPSCYKADTLSTEPLRLVANCCAVTS